MDGNSIQFLVLFNNSLNLKKVTTNNQEELNYLTNNASIIET